METQLQIRRNVEAMQDYVQDLNQWVADVEAQDKRGSRAGNRRTLAAAHTSVLHQAREDAPAPAMRSTYQRSSEVPPPRSHGLAPVEEPERSDDHNFSVQERIAAASGRLPVPARPQQPSSKEPAAHTYDNYGKRWDAYDVDAALREADQPQMDRSQQDRQESRTGGSRSRVSEGTRKAGGGVALAGQADGVRDQTQMAAEMKAEENLSAGAWKDRGNSLLRVGRLEEAEACYGRSLKVDATCVAYANRALVRLRLGKASDAEEDSTQALAVDANYVKAYLRRAAARKDLGKLDSALDDLESALLREPRNAAAQRELDLTFRDLCQREKLQTDFPTSTLLVLPRDIPRDVAASTSEAGDDTTKQVGSTIGSTSTGSAAPARLLWSDATQPPSASADSEELSAQQQPQRVLPLSGAPTKMLHSRKGVKVEYEPVQNTPQDLASCKLETNVQVRASGSDARTASGQQQEVSGTYGKLQEGSASKGACVPAVDSSKAKRYPGSQARPLSGRALPDDLHVADTVLERSQSSTLPYDCAKLSGGQGKRDQAVTGGGEAQGLSPNTPSPRGSGSIGGEASGNLSNWAQPAIEARAENFCKEKQPQPLQHSSPVEQAKLWRQLGGQPPTSTVEFEAQWRGLRGQPSRQQEYLRLITPAHMEKSLVGALPPQMLGEIVAMLVRQLATEGSTGLAASQLVALSRMPRFKMSSMCFPLKLRAEVQEAAQQLQQPVGSGVAAVLQQLGVLS